MANETQDSSNPTHKESLSGVFSDVLRKFLEGVDDTLPAEVISYDRDTNRVTVKPMIRMLKTDGTLMDRAAVAEVPVLNLGGGNAVLSFNLVPGDLGWIKATDRDMSLFMQKLARSGPNTRRIHSFSDAVFISDKFKQWTLNAEDATSATFQSLDGKQRVVIHDDHVKITSDFKVVTEAPITEVRGQLHVLGAIFAEDDITADAFTSKISLISHTHAQDPDNDGDTEEETEPPTPTP